jgi:hypothetical protein
MSPTLCLSVDVYACIGWSSSRLSHDAVRTGTHSKQAHLSGWPLASDMVWPLPLARARLSASQASTAVGEAG